MNYPTIPSLAKYLLVDQDHAQVILLHRRHTDWPPEIIQGLHSSIHPESVDLTRPLTELYEDIPGIA